MGDRCYMEFDCAPADLEKLMEKFKEQNMHWDEVQNDGSGLVVYEANYAYYNQIEALIGMEDVPPFCYNHQSGGEYDPGCGVVVGHEHEYMDANRDGSPVVLISRTGVSDENLGIAAAYYALLDKFITYRDMRG